MNAEQLIQHYTSMTRKEQRYFDKQLKNLRAFRKNINAIADAYLADVGETLPNGVCLPRKKKS
jgi:hypothetical protein